MERAELEEGKEWKRVKVSEVRRVESSEALLGGNGTAMAR